MTTKIRVTAKFDCTTTGVTGHFKPAQLPFRDQANQLVDSEQSWVRSRNQQRNYETLLQIIGLYTQPMEITKSVATDDGWQFEFETEFDGVFSEGLDSVALLKKSSNGVPILINIDSTVTTALMIPDTNIKFEIVSTK